MTLKCDTIKDLIPLVLDGVASEPSVSLVNEHISGCESCREYYNTASQKIDMPVSSLPKYDEAAEAEQLKKLGQKVKKRRSILVTLAIIGAIAYLILVLLSVSGLLFLFTPGANQYSTTDITQYGNYSGHIAAEEQELDSFTNLALFPEELTDGYQVDGFYYYCSPVGLNNIYQIYLSYTLPPEEFQAEVERLSQLVEKPDTTSFAYPAYVRRMGGSEYEYALVDEENNRIICILSRFRDIGLMPMDAEYLPE